ncbi:MAG: ABC transporter permease subunit [Nitrospirae bacterium]|nr:MAG: ABC transporter permease subunit [Nitrospirota bacterium]
MNRYVAESAAETASVLAPARIDSRAWRQLLDRLAQVIISLGGYAVILSILGIFVFLVMEVAPLFFAPTGQRTGQFLAGPLLQSLPQATLVGVEEHQEVAYLLKAGDTGHVSFFSLPSGKPLETETPAALAGAPVTAVTRASGKGGRFGLGTADGRLISMDIEMAADFVKETRRIVPRIAVSLPIQIIPTKDKVVRLAYQRTDAGTAAAVLTESGRLWHSTVLPPSNPEAAPTVNPVELTAQITGTATALLLDGRGETLAVGTADGRLYYWDVRETGHPVLLENLAVSRSGAAVTTLAYLIGDRSLVIGTGSGEVSAWMPVRATKESNATRLLPIHQFGAHPAAVTGISPSQRDKGFVTGDAQGNVFVHYATSGQTLLRFPGDGIAIGSLMFAPKANGAVAMTDAGLIASYAIHNPHPEITFASLFQPVWYEGYEQPEHVWQSSGATDDFEAKFGLTPLLFGTIKGTLYAMLLAVPLAVLGAIYTSMFMHPDLRAKIKPTIEIMAALPTVVLGFLAGLWMAPLLERIFPAVLAMFVVLPLSAMLAALLWQLLPCTLRNGIRPGVEAFLLMPVLVGAAFLCLSFNASIESLLFGADYKNWLANTLGLRYDQRNALVVGFAMGFAIIPIIFSISEEALSNVPRNLIAGSLALGATPWQTLARLVFISASPGIFSALMIGFGRAVGETMIVLMATGNTPIMDWSLFNGFRTLSANIAVEIPEAPHGGTLYRTLFMAALLLFAITFLVNTGAEIIRQRLRKKYSQF